MLINLSNVAAAVARPSAGRSHRSRRHALTVVSSLSLVLLGGFAQAQTTTETANAVTAAPSSTDSPERWNLYGQTTYIWQRKPSFNAAYTNLNDTPNSLLPDLERSDTWSATLFMGARAWQGGEFYLVPEMISEIPLSGLRGLGGAIQNGELEKNGVAKPSFYLSRGFLRQTWNLSGASSTVESAPMQLAANATSERLVLTAGKLSVIDIFDRNSYTGDVRSQFLNMAFLTHAAYDFAADSRGYTWGLAGEYYWGDWALRFGRFAPPTDPNQEAINLDLWHRYGDQIELEHDYQIADQAGKLRLLAYRNVEDTGNFANALAALQANPANNAANCSSFNYGSTNASAPDLCWARQRGVKMGMGVNVEQQLNANLGLFARAMVADGKTEVYSYTSADRSASAGLLWNGAAWQRAQDSAGMAWGSSWLSGSHIAYLAAGGVDGFIGDGALSYRPESVVEAFYNWGINKSMAVTADVQYISNPAYNSARGPVSIFGLRLHAQF